MEFEASKGKPLLKEETKALLELIEKSKIITNKSTNATNNKLKAEEWRRITEKFNATTACCPRTPQQLRLKWENLKKNSRKRSTTIRMNTLQTGGGAPEYIPPDEILDRVSALLGSTIDGFTVHFGGDAEPNEEEQSFFINTDGHAMDSTFSLSVLDNSGGGGGVGTSCMNTPAVGDDISMETRGKCDEPQLKNECLDITPIKPKKCFMNAVRTSGKRKLPKPDERHMARNDFYAAMTEYYKDKQKYVALKSKKLELELQKMKDF